MGTYRAVFDRRPLLHNHPHTTWGPVGALKSEKRREVVESTAQYGSGATPRDASDKMVSMAA